MHRLPLRWKVLLATSPLVAPFVLDLPTPREYSTFGRAQLVDHAPDPQNVMRIWVAYVGQGDGILIQLPERFNYDRDTTDANPAADERLDIMIDGGAQPGADHLMAQFVETVYGNPDTIIEHAVITHHDRDHILGLIHLLEQPSLGVETIYHNGAASYDKQAARFDSFPHFDTTSIQNAVHDGGRAMTYLETDRMLFRPPYVVVDRAQLQGRQAGLYGDYQDLAAAILTKTAPIPVAAFNRTWVGNDFIAERESATRDQQLADGNIEFDLVWPRQLRKYPGGWSKVINGNSLTFRLRYNDFSMLFTGDMNHQSEEVLHTALEQEGQLSLLECDVLKLPHHGAGGDHAYKPFFDACDPVISVASMGTRGFRSKQLYKGNWQHPGTDVVKWVGGSHRVYHTLIEESRFRWDDLTTEQDHVDMHEVSHVLIETDGDWFRIVEVDADDPTNLNVRTVQELPIRGDGTRWIRAN